MWVVEFLLLAYFIYVVAYTTAFSLGGFFYNLPVDQNSALNRFCVLIPCYKEDGVIIEVARKALTQKFPQTHYTVVIIADSLQQSTLDTLKSMPLKVIEVNFELSTKVKALNFALNAISDQYDYAVILDADNVMEQDFLVKMNLAVGLNAVAVQGQRKPKNSNNSLALLDGVSEAINNHIYRQGTVALGMSSAISGSGVAFQYKIFKKHLSSMTSIGGFDRELELLLLREGFKVKYLKTAIVYDEKVSKSGAFQNQRKRWISSQYHYLGKYFFEGLAALVKGDLAFFNSSVLRNIQLPRLINIGLLTLLTVGFYFIQDWLFYGYAIWLILFSVNTIAILMAIPREFFTKELGLAILQLPIIFMKMFTLLFKLGGANKKFIHTPHTYHSTENAQEPK
jgi:cellulose synthase/poly-beta-1,6-N-acetylglucosamine synthase-like glycosyltransferase